MVGEQIIIIDEMPVSDSTRVVTFKTNSDCQPRRPLCLLI
jgi:hypothetical protein